MELKLAAQGPDMDRLVIQRSKPHEGPEPLERGLPVPGYGRGQDVSPPGRFMGEFV